MNIGIYINSKDKNAKRRVGLTHKKFNFTDKKITIYSFYNNIQRPIKGKGKKSNERG